MRLDVYIAGQNVKARGGEIEACSKNFQTAFAVILCQNANHYLSRSYIDSNFTLPIAYASVPSSLFETM